MRRLAPALLAVTILFGVGASASAQTAPVPAADHASPEAVRHMLATMHLRDTMNLMLDKMMDTMLAKMPSNMTPEQAKAVQGAMHAELPAFIDSTLNDSVTVYAQNLSASEVAAMESFYASPAAQSAIAKMPAITQQLMPLIMSRIPELTRRMVDHMCDTLSCTAAQRTEAQAQAAAQLKK